MSLRSHLRRLWHRRPVIVCHDRLAQLQTQLPSVQRKLAGNTLALQRLCAAHTIERQKHRSALAQKESLKALVREHAPDLYREWLAIVTKARP